MNLVRVGELVAPVTRKGPDHTSASFTYVDLSSVDAQQKAIISPSEVPTELAPSRARQNLQPNDVLVSTVRPNLNGVAAVPAHLNGAIGSTGFAVLRPRGDQVDPRYLFQWVRSPEFIESMTRAATGASYPAVTDAIVKSSRIPLPPLPEQRRIAAILDEADALRRARDRQQMLINRSVEDRVGQIVASAPGERSFGELLAEPLRNGISPSRGGHHHADVLTLSAITRGSFDANQRKSDVFAAPHAADKLVTEGLHLICRGNGNADLVGSMVAASHTMAGVAFPDTMIATRPSTAIKSAALLAAWRSDSVRDQIRRSARTTNGTFKINQQTLSAIRVPVGTADQQYEIEALEQERARLLSTVRQSSVELDALFASLQHRAFRGEL